jgi:5-methylcytosine-specific restriction endonuclease McrA
VDTHGEKAYNSCIRNAPALLRAAGGVSQDGVNVMTFPIISPENPQLKRCSKCGELKPREAFHSRQDARDGYRSYCRACEGVQKRARTSTPEGAMVKKAYYNAHKNIPRPDRSEYFKQYRAEHREERKATDAQYRESHREERGQYDRAYRTLPRVQDANRLKGRIGTSKRRAAKARTGGKYTAADIEAIRVAQGNRCYICHKKLKKYHIDHFIPLLKGGSNDPGNLRLACPRCNLRKHDKHPHDIGILI